MIKNLIAAVVGSLCALLLCESHSSGQGLSGTSLNVTGPATLQGGLTVSGTTDLSGNSLYFGSWVSDAGQPGVSLLYTDGTSASAPSQLAFWATRSSHEWLWEHEKADQSGTVPTMKLDANHVLTIYNTAGTAAIVLDPSSPSSPTAVLTQQAADIRYVSSANFTVKTLTGQLGEVGPAIALTGGTATGVYSFAGISGTASGDYSTASGHYSTANGYYSIASGVGSHANGNSSTASGNSSTASGNYSTASGYSSTASGNYSTASGYSSTASGYSSTASGSYSTASGDYSTAAGANSRAAGYSQFVVGRFNVLQGNPSSWVPTDDLFTIGNGSNSLLLFRSNAFVVKKNGDTTVYGKLTVSATSGGIVVSGTANVVLINPAGDLSMGQFTTGATPQ